jgi:hypothetical protein
MTTMHYYGLRPDDPGGRLGLRNPERGWRLETIIAEPPKIKNLDVHGQAAHLKGRIFPVYNDHWWLLDAERYTAFGLTMLQTYCYLDEFAERPISDEKLLLLQSSLDRIRAHGYKTLLRFAYENGTQKKGPTVKQLFAHLDQLAPVIRANADIIYVLQAGFVGAWGEWHSSARGIENDHAALADLVERILEILPPDRMTQVRVPKYKRWALRHEDLSNCPVVDERTAHQNLPFARIGFHNDGFLARNTCGWTWPEPPCYSNPGNPEFDYMTRESPFVPVDGELFWRDIGGVIDGQAAIRRMALHHYGTFSLWHSFSGREGAAYSIDHWRQAPISSADVMQINQPGDGYFIDMAGNPVGRTQFEYVTDHLGYRLELMQAQYPEIIKRNEPLAVTVVLGNRGFAVCHNPRPVSIALISAAGKVTEFLCTEARPCEWHSFHPGGEAPSRFNHSVAIKTAVLPDLESGYYQIGLWLPDASPRLRLDPRYAIRLANRDVSWWVDDKGQYGINIFAVLEVQ